MNFISERVSSQNEELSFYIHMATDQPYISRQTTLIAISHSERSSFLASFHDARIRCHTRSKGIHPSTGIPDCAGAKFRLGIMQYKQVQRNTWGWNELVLE